MVLAPELIGPALNAAVLLERAGRSGEAEPLFRRALALNPQAYRENLGLALFLARNGRECDGLPYFAAARQAAPSASVAQLDSVMAVIRADCPPEVHR
jgi:Flp pilus assembly protein TadD